MKKIISIFTILTVFFLLTYLFCYRFPTAKELIANEQELNPNHKDIKVNRIDTDVGGVIWFSYLESNSSKRTEVGVEFPQRWVLPWQSYFDTKI